MSLSRTAEALRQAARDLLSAADEVDRGRLLRADTKLHTARTLAKDANTVLKQTIKNRSGCLKHNTTHDERVARAEAALPGGE